MIGFILIEYITLLNIIAEKENGDLFIIEMAALLHDIDDWKFSEGTETDTTVTERFLNNL